MMPCAQTNSSNTGRGSQRYSCQPSPLRRLRLPWAAGHPIVPIHSNVGKAFRLRYRAASGKSDPGDAYDLTGWRWTGLLRGSARDRELRMKRGQRPSAEQVALMLRQIEVQTAQGKGFAVARKEADISEQKLKDECLRQEIFYSLKEAQIVIGLWQTIYNRVRPHPSLGDLPPAPVSYPDVAFRLPMARTMQ